MMSIKEMFRQLTFSFWFADKQAAITSGLSTSLSSPSYFNTSSNQSNMIWCSRLSLLTPQ